MEPACAAAPPAAEEAAAEDASAADEAGAAAELDEPVDPVEHPAKVPRRIAVVKTAANDLLIIIPPELFIEYCFFQLTSV